jgi:hypothetical protein
MMERRGMKNKNKKGKQEGTIANYSQYREGVVSSVCLCGQDMD